MEHGGYWQRLWDQGPGILLISSSHLMLSLDSPPPQQSFEVLAILNMIPIFHMAHFPYETQEWSHNLPKVTRISWTHS